jgi:tartrate dehydratase alpha subunit/fumarate hydratase class I-like protein
MGKSGFKAVKVKLVNTDLTLYAGSRLIGAVQDIVNKASLYEGVKLAQIMEAVYLQGQKDGARRAFEQIDQNVALAKKIVPHKRPGQPKKRK